MRKEFSIVLVIVTFFLLTGCNKEITSKIKIPKNTNNTQTKDNSVQPKENSVQPKENIAQPKENSAKPKESNSKKTVSTTKIENYYPFEKNVKYSYVGDGNEYATYTVNVDYLKGDRQQLRVNNGGTEVVKVLENKYGQLRVIFSKGEIYYRENLTSQINNKPEILLKEPLTKGTSWTLSNGSKRSITNIKFTIKTPLASYKCIEVTTAEKESIVKNYYAPNIGLVKTIFSSNGSEITSTLNKMEKNVPFVQTVKFYYPNGYDSMNYASERKLSFNTNDITKKIFEKYFKEAPNKNVGKLISSNTTIKSLYLNKDNMVYVDFSKEFTGEMNAGSGYESQILQCITNTLGDYYSVKNVYITVEGKPYSSGHILMKKGEAFIVDYKNTK